MAKRFTDSEKWEDGWFIDLSIQQKLIWIYLLDHCDNAGLWKINIKNLNYFCSTNISVEDVFNLFKGRLTKINNDIAIINKFCYFQYGPDFLNSKNKAVISAVNKLIILGIVKELKGINTLTIPYEYPIDTPKEKEEDKEEDKEEVKDEVKVKLKDEVKDKFEYKTKEQKEKMSKEELEQYFIQEDIFTKTIK
jgi:hypothetical protein